MLFLLFFSKHLLQIPASLLFKKSVLVIAFFNLANNFYMFSENYNLSRGRVISLLE